MNAGSGDLEMIWKGFKKVVERMGTNRLFGGFTKGSSIKDVRIKGEGGLPNADATVNFYL